MTRTFPNFKTGYRPYLIAVVIWSTLFWSLSYLLAPGTPVSQSVLFLIGGAGPVLVAIFMVHGFEERAMQLDFWRRTFDPSLMPLKWVFLSFLLHPAIVCVSVLIAGDQWDDILRIPDGGIVGILSLLFFTFWFGPLPEEIGWRGFALDRMLVRFSSLDASILIGLAWGVWHVPLFFIPGTFQYDLGFGSLRFFIFSGTLIPLSILMTWVYNHCSRSTLSAAIIHFSGNVAGAMIIKDVNLAALELLLLTLCSLLVIRHLNPSNTETQAS